jgi:Protein of unknown function (DUF1376)
MGEDLPEPLVPADADLRQFGYMALDVVRLRDSDLVALANGEEFKAAVLLYCVAWHQVPAGSLPSDDRLLARYSGAGPRWAKVKPMALRGFVRCADGRLYHPVVAEKVLEALERKQAQRERTRKATEARRRSGPDQRDDGRNDARDVDRNDDRNVHQGKDRKGEDRNGEEGNGLERIKTNPTVFSPSTQTKAGGKNASQGENEVEYPAIPRYIHNAWIDKEVREGRLKVGFGEEYPAICARLIAERSAAKSPDGAR